MNRIAQIYLIMCVFPFIITVALLRWSLCHI